MPVRDRLPECSVPAMRQKVQQLLQYAVKGVQENSTGAGTQVVLQWAWGQLKRSLAQVEDSADANGNVSGSAGGAGVRFPGSGDDMRFSESGMHACLWKIERDCDSSCFGTAAR
jgi:hypothetical protein